MRGQSSFEAIALFATASLILTIFMLYFGTQIGEKAEEREFESLKDIAGTIRQEILLARQAGPGYERTITIPPRGAGKEIIFTIRYPDSGPGPTEMTVRFDPPLSESLEASDVLGEGVYGTFSGGTNTIRTYEGGITVEPDPEEIVRLLDSSDISFDCPVVDVAFASIGGSEVRMSETIECDYGVSNEWAFEQAVQDECGDDPNDYNVYAAWRVNDSGSVECSEVGPFDIGDEISSPTLSLMMRKGVNLSCRVAVSKSPVNLCPPAGSSTPRIADSNWVRITNSQPVIDVTSVASSVVAGDASTGSITWRVDVDFEITDPDTYDYLFNASLVKDGTNANFIDCTNCETTNLPKEQPSDLSFTITLPVPEGESCADIDTRLSFKLRAIEADGSSELYTLETVDEVLPCGGSI